MNQAGRFTTPATQGTLVSIATARPGTTMFYMGGTYSVTSPVTLILTMGDDPTCATNPRELTTPVPAWQNQPATFPPEPVASANLCVVASVATTISGTSTVLR
jgi:hypothetical protein